MTRSTVADCEDARDVDPALGSKYLLCLLIWFLDNGTIPTDPPEQIVQDAEPASDQYPWRQGMQVTSVKGPLFTHRFPAKQGVLHWDAEIDLVDDVIDPAQI
jgi:hypothetical protein